MNNQQLEIRNGPPIEAADTTTVPQTGPRGLVVRVVSAYNDDGVLQIGIQFPVVTSAVLTAVPDSMVAQQLVVADAARKGVSFYNSSSANLYLALSALVSTTLFKVKLVPGAYYEPPATFNVQGGVYGVWDAAPGGAVQIEEDY